jgi:hypothetical protein
MNTVLPELEEQLAEATRRRAARARRPTPPPAPRRRIGRRRVLAAATALAAVLVAAIALLPGRSGRLPSDLAARAYAAAAAPGLVHWRTDIDGYVNGRFATRQRIEGWRLGDVTHTVHSDVVHGKEHVTVDARVAGRRARTWMSASDDYVSTTRTGRRDPIEMFPSGDPLASFRAAYRAGRLHALGGGRFDLRFTHIPAGALIYAVDPATGRPRTLTLTSPPRTIGTRRIRSRIVVRFKLYETLTPTAASRAALALRPHPGAGPGRTPARELFAALRAGAPTTTSAAADRVRSLATHMHRHVDPEGIRPVADNIWLASGRGYVCLFVASSPSGEAGVGGTCATTTVAARRGISVSMATTTHLKPGAEPELRTLLVVPDDVRTVRITSGQTFTPDANGLVDLPPRTYNPRLVR